MFGLRFCKIKQNIRKENSKLHRTEVSRNRAEVSRVKRWKFQEFAFKETFHHAQTNSGHNKLKPNVHFDLLREQRLLFSWVLEAKGFLQKLFW